MSTKSAKKSSSRRSVDSESRKPKVTQKIKNKRPPSPIYQEESDPEESNVENELSDEQSEQEEIIPEKKKKSSLKKSFSKKSSSKNTLTQPLSDDDEKEETDVSPHLAVLLALTASIGITGFEYKNVSTFTVSSFAFYGMLYEIERILDCNKYLLKICPYYNSLYSHIYYGMLFGLQIIRSRIYANEASTTETKLYNSFIKQFPEETLPIASPMAGFFEILGCVTLEDERYGMVCPGPIPAYGNFVTTSSGAGSYTMPPLPHLLTLLKYIGESSGYQADSIGLNLIASTTAGIAGMRSRFSSSTTALEIDTINNLNKILHRPGWHEVIFPSNANNIAATKKFVKQMNIPTFAATSNFDSAENYLLLDRNNSLHWFSQIIKVMTIQATFFKGSTNFSKFGPTASSSFLVCTKKTAGANRTPLTWVSNTNGTANDTSYLDGHKQFDDTMGVTYFTRNINTSDIEFRLGAACQYMFVGQDDTASVYCSQTTGPYFTASTEVVTAGDVTTAEKSSIQLYSLGNKSLPMDGSHAYLLKNLYLPKGE